MQEDSGFGSHLQCDFQKPARLFCCFQQCDKIALICRTPKCQCLNRQHKECEFIYGEYFLTRLEQRRKQSQDWNNTKQGDDKTLKPQEKEIIEAIIKNDRKKITGKLIYAVKDLLDEMDEKSDQES